MMARLAFVRLWFLAIGGRDTIKCDVDVWFRFRFVCKGLKFSTFKQVSSLQDIKECFL
jgi:hypothetical protein